MNLCGYDSWKTRTPEDCSIIDVWNEEIEWEWEMWEWESLLESDWEQNRSGYDTGKTTRIEVDN